MLRLFFEGWQLIRVLIFIFCIIVVNGLRSSCIFVFSGILKVGGMFVFSLGFSFRLIFCIFIVFNLIWVGIFILSLVLFWKQIFCLLDQLMVRLNKVVMLFLGRRLLRKLLLFVLRIRIWLFLRFSFVSNFSVFLVVICSLVLVENVCRFSWFFLVVFSSVKCFEGWEVWIFVRILLDRFVFVCFSVVLLGVIFM